MELTAMDIYKLLPKTNCGRCGESSCMAFATKLLEKKKKIEDCPLLSGAEKEKLEELLAPAVKEITFGKGKKKVTIGGDEVLYRYQLTFYNPTALAIDVTDEENFMEKVKRLEKFEIERTGEKLTLDAIALRNKSNDPEKFAKAAEKLKNSKYPLILCSFNSKSMEAALKVVGDERPIIYAATEENIDEMAELAKKYDCPLVLFVQSDLEKMKELSRKLRNLGVEDIILDPGTLVGEAIGDTLDNFTMIRRLAIEEKDDDFRFPIMGVPALARMYSADEIEKGIREAMVAAALINRYADILILRGTEVWELLPVLTLRQSIYTDPRKPQAVDPGLYEFGKVDENSPVIITTNFSLTYYTVEGDLKSGKANCYLLVLDTGGKAVDVSVAGGQFNGKAVADLIKETGIEEKVKHRTLIIPGLAASVSGEIEDETGWKVVVGPRDSSELPDFLEKKAIA
ncbi:acetyl-CoA decarbonylase/synthase gamma subunit [Methanothermus fervidus DSM 2088]|uniref:Acetyl-CoA decarbonylase/synthase complex subunit gamma n=1 Tax=Methanothermus fervidus (strain ATCC 43054 / DSM 2088 / JCM 10308 / V24 S) TaxID=523846 RepID=E3GYE0_METFV|nr:acetyl-CoA decarbonylase/synthase gamma subunit [Methanothermus fervidus DSM 2088]